jgi:hypothetical protein
MKQERIGEKIDAGKLGWKRELYLPCKNRVVLETKHGGMKHAAVVGSADGMSQLQTVTPHALHDVPHLGDPLVRAHIAQQLVLRGPAYVSAAGAVAIAPNWGERGGGGCVAAPLQSFSRTI